MPDTATSVSAEPRDRGIPAPRGAGVNVAPGPEDDGWDTPPPVKLADGTEVQLYKDGEMLHAAYRAIGGARRRIWLEVYIFHSDATGRAFAELLARRARQGLQVRVVFDSIGSMDSDPGVFETMRRAGVKLREFHPWKVWRCEHGWRPFNRDHRKLVVVDDEVAVLGGQNLGDEYGSSWVTSTSQAELWRDTGVGVRGPAVRSLSETFHRLWQYAERGGPIRRAELIRLSAPLGVLATVPAPRSRLVPVLRKIFRDAQRSIELTIAYFAPPEELVDELCRRARAGVRVRLMLPGRSDVPILLVAARAFYARLLAEGVEVYERQGAVLHAKTLCVDRRLSIVGSTNLDYRSIQFNCELGVLIQSETFGAQMHELFEHDVLFARAIRPSEWRSGPWHDRLVQWACMRARYLL